MGVAVSGWSLARAVARLGQLGVVSGTALETVHARLGDGDPGGHLRRAYGSFPEPSLVRRVLHRWFVAGGRPPGEAYRAVPMFRLESPRALRELTVLANFAEVQLAKSGHGGPIGINYLEKIQMPTPDALYGALLAGVDYVLMGAGIPSDVPHLLDGLARGGQVAYRVAVTGAGPHDGHAVRFDPAEVVGRPARLVRPRFVAIVSSNTLASFLAKDPETRPMASSSSTTAPAVTTPRRVAPSCSTSAASLFMARATRSILTRSPRSDCRSGSRGRRLSDAPRRGPRRWSRRDPGRATAFAFCAESGLAPGLRARVLAVAHAGTASRHRPPCLTERLSVQGRPTRWHALRARRLRRARAALRRWAATYARYVRPDGGIAYRCPSEPADAYVRKGGKSEDTIGRTCLCNALLATAGLAQLRDSGLEPPIVTSGDDLARLVEVLGAKDSWTAADVVVRVPARRCKRPGGVPHLSEVRAGRRCRQPHVSSGETPAD